jgi:hypothetical protein
VPRFFGAPAPAPRWWVPGDWNGFFGLFTNVVLNVIVLTGLCLHVVNALRVPTDTDLVEWYFEQGWTDGLPVVPPTGEQIAACIKALGGEPEFLECRVPPRYGGLTREPLRRRAPPSKSTTFPIAMLNSSKRSP